MALDEDEVKEGENGADGSEWEDEGDDEESRAAVDRVLKKYEKAPVADADEEGSFDERYKRSVQEKMDEWKRGYYQVCFHGLFKLLTWLFNCDFIRANWRFRMMIPRICTTWCTNTWRVCNG